MKSIPVTYTYNTIITIQQHPHILTPLLLVAFTIEEIMGSTIEAAKGANKTPGNPLSDFFYSMFYCFSNSIN